MVFDKDVCERWCVTMLRVKKLCTKNNVKGKTEDVVHRERRHRQRRWCRIEQLEGCMWKLCVKEGVRWKMVCEGVCVCDDFETCVCVWKMVYAAATTLKGGVSSTAVCGKMASQVARWNRKLDVRHRKDVNWPARARVCAQQGALAHNPCCHTRSGTKHWPILAPSTHSRIIPHPRPTRWQTTSRRSAWYGKMCTEKDTSEHKINGDRQATAVSQPMQPKGNQPCSCCPIKATLATQNEGCCRQAPRLPCKTHVAVAKCHACHAQRRSMSPSATPAATQKCCGAPADQADPNAPADPAKRRLPWKTKVDVAKCHACRAKCKPMSPSATPATQKCRGAPGDQTDPNAPHNPAQCQKCTPAMENESRCRQVPRLPSKTQVHVAKFHACHAKVPRRPGRPSGPKRATRPSPVSEVLIVCVCERWCVTKLCVTKMCVCVEDCMWQRFVWKVICDKALC